MYHKEDYPRELAGTRLARTATLAAIFFLAPLGHAQLPAGTRDATAAPQQDPLRTQAADALAKQDYGTAIKLLTTLAERIPKTRRFSTTSA